MLQIDGSEGEGGGQVLRTALGLSLVSGRPFRIDGIRSKRSKPGLQRQHLCAVHAAAAVSGAEVEGAELGSLQLSFRPGALRAGDWRFAVGSAGSAMLVLQTVLPGLLQAPGPSTLHLTGGTHNPMAPTFEFAQLAWAPLLARMGAELELRLLRHGFAPGGGGIVTVRITPAKLKPLELLERGKPGAWRARALLSQLPDEIGRRELEELLARFGRTRLRLEDTWLDRVQADGAGNTLQLELPATSVCEVVTAFGERGRRAEQIASAVATEAMAFASANVPVGQYLADQLLVPLALAGGGAFATVAPTLHSTTNSALIERFLPVGFAMREETARPGAWRVECRAR
jgi:RNA 3'-terminal phosphate cyclase (ATP)